MLPTPYRLMIRNEVTGPPDDWGNETTTWTELPWEVHAIAPGAMDEPGQSNRDLSTIEWTVLAPAPLPEGMTERSEVKLPGVPVWYSVNGHPRDWSKGP